MNAYFVHEVHLTFFIMFLGEYIGLTGARLNGHEMLACGLATHFVPSMVHLYHLIISFTSLQMR